jgi:copper chaperone CopZ
MMRRPARAQELIIDVEGMTCERCERHVIEALLAVPGVRSARASRTERRALITADPTSATDERLRDAITAAGYSPGDIQQVE